PRPGEPAPGWITVTARGQGELTLLTLTASGGSPVDWSLWTDAPWLYVSRASGTLRPGGTVTIAVRVDHGREPQGVWSARIGVNPSGAVVRIDGRGQTSPPPVVDPVTPPPTTTEPTTPPTSPPTTEPTTPPPTTEEPPPTTAD
ncbi:BACON domain-containing protein, partial [Streptomyces venezuelae]|uniref:BACON domain-containing protein n=1 Tax=Streptomyces venezuelae TaxID=54571 RepID=UPI003F686A2E